LYFCTSKASKVSTYQARDTSHALTHAAAPAAPPTPPRPPARLHPSAFGSIREYVSIRQHTSAYVSIRQHTSAFVSIRQHTPAYASIRLHTSAYVSICQLHLPPLSPHCHSPTPDVTQLLGVRICTFVLVKQVNKVPSRSSSGASICTFVLVQQVTSAPQVSVFALLY
jgi:hypothetical protein